MCLDIITEVSRETFYLTRPYVSLKIVRSHRKFNVKLMNRYDAWCHERRSLLASITDLRPTKRIGSFSREVAPVENCTRVNTYARVRVNARNKIR